MSTKKNIPIIIKRYDSDDDHGHHGGGWKVAYADFMTAMMAFFLLLWIVAASDEKQLRGLANYFTPTLADSDSPSEGSADLRPISTSGIMSGAAGPPGSVDVPSFGRDNPMMVFDSRLRDLPSDVIVEYADGPETDLPSGDAIEMGDAARQEEIEAIAEEIAERISEDAALKDLAQNVRLQKSTDALVVEVLDQDARSLFARGSSDVSPRTRELLLAIGGVIAAQPQRIEIVGHTDATSYGSRSDYSNWELSADRANATRRILLDAGLTPARFMRISGVADTQPSNLADPFAAENRRISIRLVYRDEP